MKEYDNAIRTLQNIQSENELIMLTIDYEIFKLNMDKENYYDAAILGTSVVENMFNSISIDDAVLSEACYNVAICNRYLGYESYNKTVEVINKGIDDKEILAATLIAAELALKYFKISKERFYDASSFDIEDQKSATYAKDLNKLIKQIQKLFIPSIQELIEK